MRKAWKKLHDNSGLTLVELICAIAIFGILSVAVGSVLVVSAKNYQRGTAEIDLQQEAQMTANQIADLVMDTTDDISYTEDASGDRMLEITKADRLYEITYKAVEMRMYYSEYQLHADASRTLVASNQLMAEYISEFKVDASEFAEDNTLQMTLMLEKDSKTYESSYTITARNGIVGTTVHEAAATITTEAQIVLEPNQDYLLTAAVAGVTDTTVNWTLSGNTDSDTKVLKNMSGEWHIQIGRDETADTLQLMVMTNAKRSDGVTPLAQKSVQVKVRRVTAVSLSVTLLEGNALDTNAKYRITASIAGTNLDKLPGVVSDNDYIDPRKVDWDYVYTKGGREVGGADWNSGETPHTQQDCYTIEEETDTSLTLRLKERILYTDNQLTVTAVVKHPEGTELTDPSVKTNKTGLPYGRVYDTYTFQKALYTRNGSVMYRGTDVNQGNVDIGSLQAITNAMYGQNYWDQNRLWRKFRYREVITDPGTGAVSYGPWTSWLLTTAEAGSSFNIRPDDTRRFEPNKDYDVEFKFEAYKDGAIIWPVADTDPEAYSFMGRLNHAKLAFNFNDLGITNAFGISKDSPAAAVCGTTYNINYQGQPDEVVGIKIGNFQNNLQMKVEKLIDGTWTQVSDADCKLYVQGNLYQQHQVTFYTPGSYRLVTGLKSIPFRTGGYNTYTEVSKDYWLGNDYTGDGYYYFNVN